jgi:hypothetical protein
MVIFFIAINLSTLEGSPTKVGRGFIASNHLTPLEHSPITVGGDFTWYRIFFDIPVGCP